MYHGGDPGLMALDMLEQRFKEARHTLSPEELPGMTKAWRMLQDTISDVRPSYAECVR